MTDTLLADLVRRQSAASVLGSFSRTIDKVAEDLALEILRDPEFREEMRQLIRLAVTDALRQLHEPPPPSVPRPEDELLRTARAILNTPARKATPETPQPPTTQKASGE